MRPVDHHLREKYKTAAAELGDLGKSVTGATLAAHLGIKTTTARTFLDRNKDFAASINVIRKKHVSQEEYRSAKLKILSEGTEPTTRRIGKIVGVDHSSVTRFFKKHPVLARVKTEVVSQTESRTLHSEQSWVTSLRRSREITAQYYDCSVLRVVLNKVSPEKYIELWDAKILKFQYLKQEKPDFMPTRDEVCAYLQK